MPSAVAATMFFGWPLPVDAAAHGPALDRHLLLNLMIALGLALLAHVLVLLGVLFRRRKRKPIHKVTLEFVPLLALCVLFAWLSYRAEKLWAAERYTGASPAALQVEVTGEQFAWYFRYPGADAMFGRTNAQFVDAAAGNPVGIDTADSAGKDDVMSSVLTLPQGREVDIALRALDVIHGFSVPELRLKQNAIPGQVQHIHFTATRAGDYALLCTQVCGLGHYRMTATVRVLPEADFRRWLQQQARP